MSATTSSLLTSFATPSDRLVPLVEVASTIGASRSKLYELMEAGEFPIPVKIGRRTHFSEREVQKWIAERLATRGGMGGQ